MFKLILILFGSASIAIAQGPRITGTGGTTVVPILNPDLVSTIVSNVAPGIIEDLVPPIIIELGTNFFIARTNGFGTNLTAHGIFIGNGEALTNNNNNIGLLTPGQLVSSNQAFNISLQAILSDIIKSNYLSTTNGVTTIIPTNATTATIQAGINRGGVMWFTPYNYSNLTNIYLTNSITILGNGATLSFSPSMTGFGMDSGTNGALRGPINIEYLMFNGSVNSQYNNTTYAWLSNGTPNAYYNPHWTNHSALRVESSHGGEIHGCQFYAWSGNGVMMVNTNNTDAEAGLRMSFHHNLIYSNFLGVILPGYNYEMHGFFPAPITGPTMTPEYQELSHNIFFANQIGIQAGAGNWSIVGNMFGVDYIPFYLGSGVNAAHGEFIGNKANHCNSYSGWIESNNGGVFVDNTFLAGGPIIANNVTELQFKNNNIGVTDLVMTNGCSGEIMFNHFQGTWGSAVATNFTGSPLLTVCGNISNTGETDDCTVSQNFRTNTSFMINGTQIIPTNLPAGFFPWYQNSALGTIVTTTNGAFLKTTNGFQPFLLGAAYDLTNSGSVWARYYPDNLAFTDGQLIQSLSDISGNGFHMITNLFAPAPMWSNNTAVINNKGFLRFEGGVSSGMWTNIATSFAQPFTIYMVCRPPNNGDKTLWHGTGLSSFMSSGALFLNAGSQISATVSTNSWYIIEYVCNNTSSTIKTNGVLAASGTIGSGAMSGLYLGATFGGVGNALFDLGYFAVVTNAVTATRSSDNFNYLNHLFRVY